MPTAWKEKNTPAIPEELKGLQVYFSKDLWSRNDHWSAFEEWKTLQIHAETKRTAPLETHRWIFGTLKPNDIFSEAVKSEIPSDLPEAPEVAESNDSAQKTPPEKTASTTDKQTAESPAPKTESWSFNSLQEFFIRSDSQSVESESRHATGKIARLKQLSKHDSLAGWNAAILWATLSPETATDTIPILEKVAFDLPAKDRFKKKKTPPIEFFSLEDNQKSDKNKTRSETKTVLACHETRSDQRSVVSACSCRCSSA